MPSCSLNTRAAWENCVAGHVLLPSVSLAGIVCGVHVVQYERPRPVDLKSHRRLCDRVVAHLSRHHRVAPGSHILQSGLVELLTHSESDRTGEHGYVFVGRVPVWRNLVAGGELEPDRKWTSLTGVARNDGELRSL